MHVKLQISQDFVKPAKTGQNICNRGKINLLLRYTALPSEQQNEKKTIMPMGMIGTIVGSCGCTAADVAVADRDQTTCV